MNRISRLDPWVLGLLCACGFFCIWTSFIVFSRAGILTGLTPYDLAALRFIVAIALVLPFAVAWWPRHIAPLALVVLAVCGPGAVYAVLMFTGLAHSSAAYAGVFSNGSLPVFTMVITYLVTREVPARYQVAAVMLLVVGATMVGLPGIMRGGEHVGSAIAVFLAASAVIAIYVFGVRYWKLTPRQALVIVTIPNALIYLPLWYCCLPSDLAGASWQTIIPQALFQGLGPGFLAVILFAIAATNLGATPTAGFAAAVPASATLLAIPVLGEWPVALEWAGIVVVTLGLALLLKPRPRPG